MLGRHLDEMRGRNLRASTITQRRNTVRRFERWAGIDVLDADAETVRAYLHRPGVQPATQAGELSHLRQFFGWAVRRDLLEVNPAAPQDAPRLHRRLPRPTSEADTAMAVELAPERIRPWILLAGWAGLRCCEISGLRAEHVLWDQGLIVVAETKGGGDTPASMSPWLADQLAGCAWPSRGWLHPRRDGAPGPTPPHLVSQLGGRYLRSVGIDATMHQLRHRFGTQVYRGTGGDLRVTQEAMRHATSKSTEIYTYVSRPDIAAAVARVPSPTFGARLFEVR